MGIDTEQQTLAAIESWRNEPRRAQLRLTQEACDSLEMSLMYYEQKGSEQGMARVSRCLDLLRRRQAELSADAG